MPAEFDKLRMEIKASLRKAHPEWNEKKVDSLSYATAIVQWHKMGKSLK